ncbi:MAG TPA: peptide-methionine (S)-S-oxide reductase MsrA [Candidatus Limnocylindria bacterium]|nr:peptide-methionine (S)-S-oxide reductase MsrA [Candidatus Limnocylindria bacterium]
MQTQTAVFGAGCFWCVEAVYQNLRGVSSVLPGYAGGNKADPTYEEVSSGTTGHAEVAKIEFDPAVIKFSDLLNVLFATHDPTTMNRQGNDVGDQYRSAIFYTSENQKQEAQSFIKQAQKEFSSPIVTQLVPLEKFYAAENYHRDYYKNNPGNPYCQFVIDPKLEKFRKKFASLLK